MTTRTRWDPYRGLDPREMPAYTTPEAAHYLRLSEATIRAWAFGRQFPKRSGEGYNSTDPLILVADATRGLLSFANLLELHALRAIRRDHDVHMARIRAALQTLREHYPSPHPLLDRAMETDGARLFIRRYGELIDLSHHGQLAMEEVLQAHLRRIDYNDAGSPIRFFPFTRALSQAGASAAAADQPRTITIDPLIAFGRPVIAGSRTPTAEVIDRFRAGDSVHEIAADYDHTPQEIEEAVRWESAA